MTLTAIRPVVRHRSNDGRSPKPSDLTLPEPWVRNVSIQSLILVIAGLAGLIICWYGVSGTAAFRNQRSWIVGATVGDVVAALGLVWWLASGFRTVHDAKRAVLVDACAARGLPAPRDVAERKARPFAQNAFLGTSPGALSATSALLVSGPLMTMVHQQDCPLVKGKQFSSVTDEDVRSAGLRSCGVCSP
jgi:hypothetical protein